MGRSHSAGATPGNPDALLGLLLPGWQLVIGVFVVFALVVAGSRLSRRGRSRMNAALLYVAAAIVGVVVVAMVVTPH